MGFHIFTQQKHIHTQFSRIKKKTKKQINTIQDKAFSVSVDLDNSNDIDSKMTKRQDEDDKENEIEGVGDIDHMKESQEESTSVEVEAEAGPGGLAGLIANLSGVIYLNLYLILYGFSRYQAYFLLFVHFQGDEGSDVGAVIGTTDSKLIKSIHLCLQIFF